MADTTRRYLALGDSYTIGEGVPVDARWPMVMARRLRDDGMAVDDPEIIAVTGWTTDELAAGMDAATLEPPYDLVSLLIGANNQYRGRDVANYHHEFATLLERAIGLAGGAAGQVLVVSIPDWGVTRFAHDTRRDSQVIAAELNAFNAAARKLAQGSGAAWADITPVSRRCGDDTTMLAGDGLHPSGRQYAAWTDVILPLAQQCLARQERIS